LNSILEETKKKSEELLGRTHLPNNKFEKINLTDSQDKNKLGKFIKVMTMDKRHNIQADLGQQTQGQMPNHQDMDPAA
jgi:hypothetical protein